MNQATHPAHWLIRKAGARVGQKKSNSLILPMGPKKEDLAASTCAVKALMRIGSEDGHVTPRNAAIFAEAIRRFDNKGKGDMTDIRGIGPDTKQIFHEWYENFEQTCVDWQKEEGVYAQPVETEEPKAETPDEDLVDFVIDTSQFLYERVLVAAVQGFCQHAGPIADAEIIAMQARKIATMAVGAKESVKPCP
jgi:hypothetical protein